MKIRFYSDDDLPLRKAMIGFLNIFEKTQYISFEIKDKELIKKYELTWNRISNIIEKHLINIQSMMENI